MNKKNTCCFIGQRFIKMNEDDLQSKLMTLISNAIDDSYTHFISSGEMGFSMFACEQILGFKNLLKLDITLEIATPHTKQDINYNNIDKRRYEFLLQHADKISKHDTHGQFIVGSSTLAIVYFEGMAYSVKRTLDYAKSKNLHIWEI